MSFTRSEKKQQEKLEKEKLEKEKLEENKESESPRRYKLSNQWYLCYAHILQGLLSHGHATTGVHETAIGITQRALGAAIEIEMEHEKKMNKKN